MFSPNSQSDENSDRDLKKSAANWEYFGENES